MRKEAVVKLGEGLHARPASKIAELFHSTDFDCFVYVDSGEKAKLNSTLDMLSLGIKQGQKVLLDYPEAAEPLISLAIEILETE